MDLDQIGTDWIIVNSIQPFCFNFYQFLNFIIVKIFDLNLNLERLRENVFLVWLYKNWEIFDLKDSNFKTTLKTDQ